MDKVKLIHNKDKFLLEINGNPIHFVSGYKIENNVDEICELTIKMSIDMNKSSIDIQNDKVTLK